MFWKNPRASSSSLLELIAHEGPLDEILNSDDLTHELGNVRLQEVLSQEDNLLRLIDYLTGADVFDADSDDAARNSENAALGSNEFPGAGSTVKDPFEDDPFLLWGRSPEVVDNTHTEDEESKKLDLAVAPDTPGASVDEGPPPAEHPQKSSSVETASDAEDWMEGVRAPLAAPEDVGLPADETARPVDPQETIRNQLRKYRQPDQDPSPNSSLKKLRRYKFPLVAQEILASDSQIITKALLYMPGIFEKLLEVFEVHGPISPVVAGYTCSVLTNLYTHQSPALCNRIRSHSRFLEDMFRHCDDRSVAEFIKVLVTPETEALIIVPAAEVVSHLVENLDPWKHTDDLMPGERQENVVMIFREIFVSDSPGTAGDAPTQPTLAANYVEYLQAFVHRSPKLIDLMFSLHRGTITAVTSLLVEVLVHLDVMANKRRISEENAGNLSDVDENATNRKESDEMDAGETVEEAGDGSLSAAPQLAEGDQQISAAADDVRAPPPRDAVMTPAQFVDKCIGPFLEPILDCLLRPYVDAAVSHRQKRRRKKRKTSKGSPETAGTSDPLLVTVDSIDDSFAWEESRRSDIDVSRDSGEMLAVSVCSPVDPQVPTLQAVDLPEKRRWREESKIDLPSEAVRHASVAAGCLAKSPSSTCLAYESSPTALPTVNASRKAKLLNALAAEDDLLNDDDWFTRPRIAASGLAMLTFPSGPRPLVGFVCLELLTLIRALLRISDVEVFPLVLPLVLRFSVQLLFSHKWNSCLHIALGDIILTALQKIDTWPEALLSFVRDTEFLVEAARFIRRAARIRSLTNIHQRRERRLRLHSGVLPVLVEIVRAMQEAAQKRPWFLSEITSRCPDWNSHIIPEVSAAARDVETQLGGGPPVLPAAQEMGAVAPRVIWSPRLSVAASGADDPAAFLQQFSPRRAAAGALSWPSGLGGDYDISKDCDADMEPPMEDFDWSMQRNDMSVFSMIAADEITWSRAECTKVLGNAPERRDKCEGNIEWMHDSLEFAPDTRLVTDDSDDEHEEDDLVAAMRSAGSADLDLDPGDDFLVSRKPVGDAASSQLSREGGFPST